MPSDEKWKAMTEGEKITATWILLWPKMRPEFYPRILDWRAFGLVVERMREKGWKLSLIDWGGKWCACWGRQITGTAVYDATGDSAPSATALAAVRAIQQAEK